MARQTVSYCGIKYHITQLHYPNGNLVIELWNNKGDRDIITTTTSEKLDKGYAFIDTNNHPNAEKFIKKYGLGEFTGRYGFSGYCCYPIYKIDLDKLKEYE